MYFRKANISASLCARAYRLAVAAVLFLAALSSTALAQEFETTSDGNGGLVILGPSTYLEGSLVIPSRINGLPVTEIGSYAFSNFPITSVTIPDTVTKIDDDAFAYCANLTSVAIPNSVTTVGPGAFQSCTALKSATLSTGLTAVSDEMFQQCSALTSITIPDSVTSIGDQAFAQSGLTSITFGKGLVSIGTDVFDTTNLRTVVIPDSVTSFGDDVFFNRLKLSSITFGTGLTSTGAETLEFDSAIRSIVIPNNIQTIGEGFADSCTNLTTISIGSGVTTIETGAFSSCSDLRSITIPPNVTNIGENAFQLSGLDSVTIPNTVLSIGEDAFNECSNMVSAQIGNGLTSTSYFAFSNCNKLTTVTFGNAVTSIALFAFSGTNNLTKIVFEGNAPTIAPGSIYAETLYYYGDSTGFTSPTWTDSGGDTFNTVDLGVRPVISSATTASGSYGVAFSGYTITASATPTSFGASGLPQGLSINKTTGLISGTPRQAGNFSVTLTASNSVGSGTATLTLTISALPATVNLGNLTFDYTGKAIAATATTLPPRLPVTFTYNGSSSAPSAVGSYSVVATVNNGEYLGTATGTLVIAPVVPTSTAAQSSVGATGSEVNLTVNPEGLATTVYLQYGTTTAYGSTTATQSIGGGKTAVNVFALLPGLSPDTLYHYRFVMINASGTFYGPDETFTTPGFDTQMVVAKGTAATGTGTTFATFGNPAVNVNDTVAFAGTLTLASGVTSANDVGIWTIDNTNTQTLIAQLGSVAPTANNSYAQGVSGNNVVGSYYDSTGAYHAYLYNSGTYTVLNPPSSIDSDARAVSGDNVVGPYTKSTSLTPGFFYNGSTYTMINPPSGDETFPYSVSGNNVAGRYIDTNNVIHGFFYSAGAFTTVDPPGAGLSQAQGVSGDNVVGFYIDSSNVAHAFLYNSGTYTTLDPPGSTLSVAFAVDGNNVVGYNQLSDNEIYGFLYNGGSYTQLQAPGSGDTWATCISGNNVGGFYYDSSNVVHGFLYNGSTYTTIDPPGSTNTKVTGVSGNNVVGNFIDNVNINHGFMYSGGTYTVLTPPDATASFLTLGDPVFNDNGAVAFHGTLKLATDQATSTTASGIWSTSSGSLQLVARQGSAAPGTNGTVGTFATLTSFGLSESAGAVIFGTLNAGTGITAANNSGIWEGNGAADLTLKLRLGQVVGGKTITKLSFLPVETYVNGQTRSFNAAGDIAAGASFSDKTTGIVTVIGGPTAAIAEATGSFAPDISQATFTTFGNPAINNSGDLAFAATATGGGVTTADNSGIWADDSTGTLQLIARTGSGIAPGTTAATFATFSDPVYNNNEAVAFRATLKGATTATSTGIWCNSGGSLALVAQAGVTQAPGCPAGATFATFTELALPDQGGATNKGGVIFLGTLNANAAAGVTTSNDLGIWAVDSTGALQLIARTGDVVNGKTITGLAFLPAETTVNGQSRSFDQTNGDIVYLATFSDKSTAILNVVF